MKKTFLLLVTMFFLILSSIAQFDYSISGYVYDGSNPNLAPLPGHPVEVMIDSTASGWSYQNTLITDDQGFFIDSIALQTGFEFGILLLSTMDPCTGDVQEVVMPIIPGIPGDFIEFIVCDTVISPCEAMFYYYPMDSNGFMSNTIQFVDISMGAPSSWSWDFGDGTASTEQNPVHVFDQSGIYPVCLTIADSSNACTSTFCMDIEVGFPPPSGCENFFYYYSDPNSLDFTFEGYMANPSMTADSYFWDFGDGTTASGQMVTHTFPPDSTEFYTVCLTTTVLTANGDTCIYTSCQDVWTNMQYECVAMYIYYPDSANGIFFEDWSFTANGGIPSNWYWDFGDGNNSTEQNPYHIYADTGYYQVCLTIVDSLGDCTDTYCDMVMVGWYPPPPAGCYNTFYYDKTDTATLTFYGDAFMNGMVVSDISDFQWDFGDGTTGTGQTVSHTFPTDSNQVVFTVCLTTFTPAANANGDTCVAYFCDIVFLEGQGWDCMSWINYYPDSGMTYNFEGIMNNMMPADFTWEFGDGTTGTGQYISHTYAQSGFYPVTMTSVDSTGCTWTSTIEIYVGTPYFAIFGNVWLDSLLTADIGTVRLMEADSMWQNVNEVATTEIQQGGFYQFDTLPMNNFNLYFVQAELSDASVYFGQYVPTYHVSSLTWETAMPILPIFSWPADIFMIPANSINSGPGNISGTLNNLNVRGEMEGVQVMLMNESMAPYTYFTTDASGTFSFENIPYGTYVLHAEVMGVHNTQATITLSADQPDATVNFIIDGNQASLSVDERYEILTGSVELYPNPATSQAWLEMNISENTDVAVEIFNQIGQMVSSEERFLTKGNNKFGISIGKAEPGLYLVRITASNGEFITRRLIKTN